MGLDDFVKMLDGSNTIYERREQNFDHGYTPGGTTVDKKEKFTVIEVDPYSRGAYSFIFKKNGELLCTEPCGY